jgi:hypothetical protein
MTSTKTFTALWNGEPFECWRVNGQVRFKRPGEVGFKSMAESEFWRYFKPVEGEKQEAPEPTAVQGGLFS